ncbi:MAG: hypothetical protein MUC29_13290 [Pyrinomonadaceae bacterium]|nr:hypothetical protein [Pyrinomonadaceae bacterium]
MKIIAQFIFITTLLLFASCAEEPNANVENNNIAEKKVETQKSAVSDDFTILSEKVKLPFEPEDVLWQEETQSEGKKITAVIKFFQEDMGKLMPMLEKVEVNQEVGIEPEDWFPDELKTKAEQTGDGNIRGIYYKTTPFQKDSYNKGTLVQLPNTEYFILYISTN